MNKNNVVPSFHDCNTIAVTLIHPWISLQHPLAPQADWFFSAGSHQVVFVFLALGFPPLSCIDLQQLSAWWLIYPSEKYNDIWKSVGISIPNIWKNEQCSKPPTNIRPFPQPEHVTLQLTEPWKLHHFWIISWMIFYGNYVWFHMFQKLYSVVEVWVCVFHRFPLFLSFLSMVFPVMTFFHGAFIGIPESPGITSHAPALAWAKFCLLLFWGFHLSDVFVFLSPIWR